MKNAQDNAFYDRNTIPQPGTQSSNKTLKNCSPKLYFYVPQQFHNLHNDINGSAGLILVSNNLGGTLLSWELEDDLTALSSILHRDTALVNHDTGAWHCLGGQHAPPVSDLSVAWSGVHPCIVMLSPVDI